jgi:8-oxo-dGTP pyrophosphatase MutT (NUDIX family)
MGQETATSAGAIVLHDMDGELKIILGRDPKKGSNAWVLPKGHVSSGESLEQTALREIREEVGLSNVQLVTYLGTFTRQSKEDSGETVQKIIHMFLAYALGNETPQPITDPSITEAQWFSAQQAVEVIPFEEDRAFVRQYLSPMINT